MTTPSLLDALDTSNRVSWEAQYAASTKPLSLDDVHAALTDRRLCSPWLALRINAGPPGQPLPSFEEAVERLGTEQAGIADAYAIAFADRSLTESQLGQVHQLLHLLASAAWLDVGGNLLSCALATWAAQAAFVAGDRPTTELWLDLFAKASSPPPTWKQLEPVAVLREHPPLYEAPEAQQVLAGAWHGPPLVPELSAPSVETTFMDRSVWVEKVHALGVDDLSQSVSQARRAWERRVADGLDDHPAIGALREAARARAPHPPHRDDWPADVAAWAITALAKGNQRSARLAGLAAHEAGLMDGLGATMLCMADLRPGDLPFIEAHGPDELAELARSIRLLVERADGVPADALVAALTPRHPDGLESLTRLEPYTDRLIPCLDQDVSWQRQFAAVLLAAGAAEAPPGHRDAIAALNCLIADLPPPERWTPAMVDDAVQAAPTLPIEVIETIQDPGHVLVAALAARRTKGDAGRSREVLRLAEMADNAVLRLASATLLPLRIDLLEELLVAARSDADRASTAHALAGVLVATGGSAEETGELAWTLSVEALQTAEGADDPDLEAQVVATWALLAVQRDGIERDAVLARLTRALLSPTSDTTRVLLLEARAGVLSSGPTPDLRRSERDLLDAVLAVPNDSPFAAQLILELGGLYEDLGDQELAREAYLRSLETGRPGVSTVTRARTYIALARLAHDRPKHRQDAVTEALRFAAGTELEDEVKVLQAFCWLEEGRGEEALEVARVLAAKPIRLTGRSEVDLWRLVLHAEAAVGDPDRAAAARGEALAAAAGTRQEASTRLFAAALLDGPEGFARTALSYIEGTTGSPSTSADELAATALLLHAHSLPTSAAGIALAWAQEGGHALLVATLLTAQGRIVDAIHAIDTALSADPGPDLEKELLFARIEALGDARDADELLFTAQRITDAVPVGSLCFKELHNLAHAYNVGSQGEPTALEQSLALWPKALQAAHSDAERTLAAAQWLTALHNRVVATFPRSEPRVAPWLEAFVPAVPLLTAEHRRVFRRIPAMLLTPGALTHPQVVEAVEEVLRAAPDTLHDQELAFRANSIRATWTNPNAEIWATPQELRDTSDPEPTTHTWFVQALQVATPPAPPIGLLSQALEWVGLVETRPDAVDRLAAAAVEALPSAPGEDQLTLLSLFAHAVSFGENGREAWPVLWAATRALPASAPGREELLVQLRRARFDPEVPTGAPGRPLDPQARFQRAIDLMFACKQARGAGAARGHRQRAVELLRALAEERPQELHPADVQVSLGNALKLDPQPDIDGALAAYEAALRAHTTSPMPDPGKLHKVWCDALLQRAEGDNDLRSAWSHVQEALSHRRTGRLRAETLISAAQVAALHPDHSGAHQAQQAAALLTEAVELAPNLLEAMAPLVFERLRAAMAEGDTENAGQLAARLRRAWPQHVLAIDEVARGLTPYGAGRGHPTPRTVEETTPLATHEAGLAYLQYAGRLADADARLSGADALRSMMKAAPSQDIDRAIEALHRHNVHDDPAGLRALIRECEEAPPEGAAGTLTIRAMATCRLAQLGEAAVGAVRTATEEAREALSAPDLPIGVAVFLLDILAKLWSPSDTVADPVSDFDYAVEIEEQAVRLLGGLDQAPRDVLVGLGRALRYRARETGLADYERARKLYERALARDRQEGDPSLIANTLHMLSDVVQGSGYGDPRSRLEEAVQLDREAVSLARNPARRARYATNLAWALGGLAGLTSDDSAADALYSEAMSLFETHIPMLNEEGTRTNAWMNQQTVGCARALRRGDHKRAVEMSRARLERARAESMHPARVAMALHNHGDVLFRRPTPATLAQAEASFREALAYRTPARSHRQHWESAIGVAEVLIARAAAIGWSAAAKAEAVELLRSAARSARELGRGRELHRCALDLVNCALLLDSMSAVSELAKEGWSWMQEAMPYLLMDANGTETESRVAELVAFRRAHLASQTGLVGRSRNALVLSASDTAQVLRWWRRAETPWQRMLRARLEQPEGVSLASVQAMRDALGAGASGPAARALREIHQQAPEWLTEDGGLDETRRWLREREGVAVSVWPRPNGFLVALVHPRDRADRVAWIPLPPGVPVPETSLLESHVQDLEVRNDALGGLCAFAEAFLAPSLLPLIGPPPAEVLWVPHGLLRMLPPRALFRNVPVSVSSSIALPRQASERGRSDDVVVVLADPPERSMGPGVLERVCELADLAGDGTRLLAARGSLSGPTLHPRASPVHPSAERVVEALDRAGLAVLIAHGHYDGLDDAWLHLLREDGTEDRLDVATLSADPAAISGLRVVLLACDAGRTGDAVHRPGGVAGALLAAGAREVVAPLWSVTVKNAMRVGYALLEGHVAGRSFAQMLAALPEGADKPGPTLGRVSKARRAAARWDTVGFVTRVA